MYGCTGEAQDRQHSSAAMHNNTGSYNQLPLSVVLKKHTDDQAAVAGELGSVCSFKSGEELSPSILQQPVCL